MSKDVKSAADGTKKGRGKLLIILVAVLVLALGGGAAAYFFMGRDEAAKKNAKKSTKSAEHGEGDHAAADEEAEEEDEPAGDDHGPAIVPLPTFTVNLADSEATRYLRTTLSLVIKDAAKAEAIVGGAGHKPAGENVKLAMARSAVLELLTTKTAQELTTAEGKQALKKEIAEKASQAFRVKVNDVLFAEFVVQ
jgi:flagellar protein FliL